MPEGHYDGISSQFGSRHGAALQPTPSNRLHLAGALTTMDETIEILHKTISEFEGHLQLVLDPSPAPANAASKQPDSPQIVERVLRHVTDVNNARMRLTSLMERLQL